MPAWGFHVGVFTFTVSLTGIHVLLEEQMDMRQNTLG